MVGQSTDIAHYSSFAAPRAGISLVSPRAVVSVATEIAIRLVRGN